MFRVPDFDRHFNCVNEWSNESRHPVQLLLAVIVRSPVIKRIMFCVFCAWLSSSTLTMSSLVILLYLWYLSRFSKTSNSAPSFSSISAFSNLRLSVSSLGSWVMTATFFFIISVSRLRRELSTTGTREFEDVFMISSWNLSFTDDAIQIVEIFLDDSYQDFSCCFIFFLEATLISVCKSWSRPHRSFLVISHCHSQYSGIHF